MVGEVEDVEMEVEVEVAPPEDVGAPIAVEEEELDPVVDAAAELTDVLEDAVEAVLSGWRRRRPPATKSRRAQGRSPAGDRGPHTTGPIRPMSP